ncbi:MAG: FAD-binding domain-containing protein [Acidimicrobiales bacterium]
MEAGTGTDASPYHRVFNPKFRGRRCDRRGAYVRRRVHELRAGPPRKDWGPGGRSHP